jgi:hypothetical protein
MGALASMVVYFGFRPETGCAKNRGVKTLVGGNHRREVLPASGLDLAPGTPLIHGRQRRSRDGHR